MEVIFLVNGKSRESDFAAGRFDLFALLWRKALCGRVVDNVTVSALNWLPLYFYPVNLASCALYHRNVGISFFRLSCLRLLSRCRLFGSR